MGKSQQTGKFIFLNYVNTSALQRNGKWKGKTETQGKMLIKNESAFLISESGENKKCSGNKNEVFSHVLDPCLGCVLCFCLCFTDKLSWFLQKKKE
jgi:hypothetical protein